MSNTKPISDADVRAAYDAVRDELVGALNDGGFVAEWIEKNGAVYAYIDAPNDLGRVMVYLPSLVFGGLMSDRQRADAEAFAEGLADRIRLRITREEARDLAVRFMRSAPTHREQIARELGVAHGLDEIDPAQRGVEILRRIRAANKIDALREQLRAESGDSDLSQNSDKET